MTIEAYSAVTVSDVSNNPIVSVDVLYNLSSSNTTPPSVNDANWKTEADQWEDGKYFWQKTITTFEHGEPLVSEPVCITGGKGETGVGIKSIKEQYYKSTSSSNLSGGSWTTTPPVWEDGYYIWTRSQITYTDGSTGYTDHILNQYYKSITDRVLSVESTVDKQAGEIKNKVGISEVNEKISEYDQNTVKSIKDTVAEHTTSIGNITSKVGSLETTVNGDGSTVGLVEKVSNVEQTADRIHLIVESTSIEEDTEHNVTSFDLTDKAITAITNQFVIKSPNGTSTIIEGGEIKTNSVTTEMLATDAIKSSNYKNVDSDTLYSESGTFFDLVNGSITSKNFIIDSDGNTYFNGTVTAIAGEIGGCEIINGNLTVPSANISGALTSAQIATDAIKSRKFTDTSNIYSSQGIIFDLTDNGKIKAENFAIDTSGNAYFRGNIESTSGTIANWNIYDYYLDGLYESTTEYTDHIIALSSILYSDEGNKIALDLQKKIYGWVNGVYMEEEFIPSTDGDGNYAQPVIALYSKKYTNANKTTLNQTKRNFIVYGDGHLICQDGLVEIDSNGKFTAKDADIYGDIKANSITALDEYRIYYSNYDIDGNLVGISDFSNPIMQGFYDDIMFEDDGLNNSMLYIGDNLNTDGCAKISFSTFINKQTNAVTDTYVSIDSDYVSIASSGETTVNNLVAVSAYFHNDVEFNSNIICNSNIQGTLVGSMTIRGTNTISSEFDTVSNWASELVSWHYYNDTGTLASKPTTYGILQNMGRGSITHQLWFGIPNGAIYHRSGNTNGWAGNSGDGSWKTVLDSSNYTSYRHDRLISGDYGTRVYITGGSPYFIPTNSSGSYSDGTTHIGGSATRWKNIYATNGTIQTSDANEKCSIKDIDEIYEQFFMKLRGVTYMWNKRSEDDTQIHDRIHCGLIAQEVNEAAESVGLSSITVAAICRDDLDEPTFDGRTERWGINYSELHGLEIHMIQKSIKHQEEQDEEITLLKAQIIELSERLNKLEAKG